MVVKSHCYLWQGFHSTTSGHSGSLDRTLEDVRVCDMEGCGDASSIVVPMPGSKTNAMIRESALWRGIAEEALKCCEAELGREQVSGESMAADPVGVGGSDILSIFESRCEGLKCCRLRGDLRCLTCKPVGEVSSPEIVTKAGGGGAAEAQNELAVRFRFQLPSGSYATCALRQLLHNDLVMG